MRLHRFLCRQVFLELLNFESLRLICFFCWIGFDLFGIPQVSQNFEGPIKLLTRRCDCANNRCGGISAKGIFQEVCELWIVQAEIWSWTSRTYTYHCLWRADGVIASAMYLLFRNCLRRKSNLSATSQLCEEKWKQAARSILQLIDVLAALVIQNNGKLRSAASDRRSSRDDELRMHCCFNPAGAACAS